MGIENRVDGGWYDPEFAYEKYIAITDGLEKAKKEGLLIENNQESLNEEQKENYLRNYRKCRGLE